MAYGFNDDKSKAEIETDLTELIGYERDSEILWSVPANKVSQYEFTLTKNNIIAVLGIHLIDTMEDDLEHQSLIVVGAEYNKGYAPKKLFVSIRNISNTAKNGTIDVSYSYVK